MGILHHGIALAVQLLYVLDVVVVLRGPHHPVGHQEGGVEAHAELSQSGRTYILVALDNCCNRLRKSAVPDSAMVPRLLMKSALVIPKTVSVMCM